MNQLYYGDNLEVLKQHIPDDSVDLIYIDPPFNSKRNYNIIYDGATAQAEAFKDTWSLKGWQEEKQMIFFDEAQRYSKLHRVIESFESLFLNSNPSLFGYLVNMGIRIVELNRVLKSTGSFYLHCDPTASHYLKLLTDAIFGRRNFRNEIIWCYRGGGSSRNEFRRKHDVIFRYSKSAKFKFYPDGIRIPYQAEGMGRKDQSMWGRHRGAAAVYSPHPMGKIPEDWWVMDALNANDPERLGYPTQKPEPMLERIIKSSTRKRDVVLDAFCGCGTTIAVAQRLGRRWIGIDITFLSIDLVRQRLLDHFYGDALGLNEKQARRRLNDEVTIFGIPRDIEGVSQLATQTRGDRVRKEFEKWAVFSVGGVYTEKKGADAGFDGYFYIQEPDSKGKIRKTKCLIQAKSGAVGVDDIRKFDSVLGREESPLGIFITLENPTQPILNEIARMPKYHSGLGKDFSRIHIVTAKNILDDDLPHLPITRATRRARFIPPENGQNSILSESDESDIQ